MALNTSIVAVCLAAAALTVPIAANATPQDPCTEEDRDLARNDHEDITARCSARTWDSNDQWKGAPPVCRELEARGYPLYDVDEWWEVCFCESPQDGRSCREVPDYFTTSEYWFLVSTWWNWWDPETSREDAQEWFQENVKDEIFWCRGKVDLDRRMCANGENPAEPEVKILFTPLGPSLDQVDFYVDFGPDNPDPDLELQPGPYSWISVQTAPWMEELTYVGSVQIVGADDDDGGTSDQCPND